VIVFALTLLACSRFESKPEGYTGTIEVTEMEVASSVAGRIAKIEFQEGQAVNAGDLVFVLDVTTLEIQRDMAAAALETAKATVESAKAQIKTAGAGVSALNRENERLRKMEEAGVGSAQQHSSIEGQRDVALAQANSADRLVNQALAAQGQAEAALRSAERALQEAQVHAAISGVVISRNREPGEVVAPGASVITLGDLAHPRLRVYVPLEMVETLKVGAPAKVFIDRTARERRRSSGCSSASSVPTRARSASRARTPRRSAPRRGSCSATCRSSSASTKTSP